MTAQKVQITGKFSRDRAKALVDKVPEGWVVRFGPMTRTEEQNRKLWPMLGDLRRQVPGMEAYSLDDIKLRFLNALGVEMRFIPALEGNGAFPVGLRSSTLTKEQFSALIELIFAFGAKHEVVWSDPKEQAA